MNECVLTVRDQDGDITITREDLLKYATRANVIAAALTIRVCAFAFAKLSPDEPVRRRELHWRLGFPGAGLVDCVEMISHAVREGRCLQQPAHTHPEAPFSVNGQMLFEISYRGKALRVWPLAALIDETFRVQVLTWQEADENTPGRDAYLRYKEAKVAAIMGLPDSELLRWEWLESGC